jgi:isoleucyl-tRNA synthetase
LKKVYEAYERYAFDEVFRLLLTYMSNDLSSFYCDFTKDTLYIEAKNHPARRSIQTVFYDHLSSLVRVFNPIIPFTCDEVYHYMPVHKHESVYLESLPEVESFPGAEELLVRYASLDDYVMTS